MKGRPLSENEIVAIAKDCIRLLDEKKARDIVLMDLRKVNSYLDYFLIATGNSHIHCMSLAREVQRFFRENRILSRNRPRLDTDWIVLDYNETVIHIFTQEKREYYQLDKLWADADRVI